MNIMKTSIQSSLYILCWSINYNIFTFFICVLNTIIATVSFLFIFKVIIKPFVQILNNKMRNIVPIGTMPISNGIHAYILLSFFLLIFLFLFVFFTLIKYIFLNIKSVLIDFVRVHDLYTFSCTEHTCKK